MQKTKDEMIKELYDNYGQARNFGNPIEGDMISKVIMYCDIVAEIVYTNNRGYRDQILALRGKLRKPLEDQSDKCIELIYNILENDG